MIPIERINPDTLHKNPAFTQVMTVSAGSKLIFVGGQNAVNAKGEIIGADIAAQSKQTFKNVVLALEAAGAAMKDVFKMTIYMVQGQDLLAAFVAAQEVEGAGGSPPTVSVIFVSALAHPQYLIEIEVMAAIDQGSPS